MKTIKKQFDEIYNDYKTIYEIPNKMVFAADVIFGLKTYDDDMSYLFVKNIIEVLKVIINEENFEYIKNKENYVKFLIVCNFLYDKIGCIDWGTSIRGAWLVDYCKKPYICEWYSETSTKTINIKIPYSPQNIIELVEWLEDEK